MPQPFDAVPARIHGRLLPRGRGCPFYIYAPTAAYSGRRRARHARQRGPSRANSKFFSGLTAPYMPTVTIDGEDHQVDADNIAYGDDESPSGYVHQDDVEKIVQKRASRAERTTKQALKDDDDFFREAAQARGIELRDDGKPKGSVKDEELQQLRQKASKVDSLQEQVQTYESQMQETRRTQLHNSVLSSLDRPVQDGAQDDVLNVVERNAKYDGEYGWVITDSNGNVQFEGGEPVTPDQFVTSTLPEQKPYLFKSTEMSGGPSDQPGGSGGGKTWTRQEYEAAARRTHEMSQDEYKDWEAAPDEGRITE